MILYKNTVYQSKYGPGLQQGERARKYQIKVGKKLVKRCIVRYTAV